MSDPDERDAEAERGASRPGSEPRSELSASLVSRWLAAAVLVVLVAAAALSAWLLVTADLDGARPPAAAEPRSRDRG